MKQMYLVFLDPHPIMEFQDTSWARQHVGEVLKWCKKHEIQVEGRWTLRLNSIDEAVMFKLRFGV